jgi:hypothetical protein
VSTELVLGATVRVGDSCTSFSHSPFARARGAVS